MKENEKRNRRIFARAHRGFWLLITKVKKNGIVFLL